MFNKILIEKENLINERIKGLNLISEIRLSLRNAEKKVDEISGAITILNKLLENKEDKKNE